MGYDFDTFPDRSGTGSLKWQRYEGRDILPFWVADMDFRSAPEIIEGIQRRLEHQVFGYTLPPPGTIAAVQEYLQSHYQWTVSAEQLLWLPGLVPALNVACRAYCEEGEEVISFTPVYPPFLLAPSYAKRGLVSVPLALDGNRWTIDFDRLEQSVTPRSKLLLFCNPHNPVGTVFTRDELIRLGEFCERHDLVLCSDEIHCDLVLEKDQPHIPIASISPELAERTVTLMAPSKTYNLAGLACAFGVFPNERLRNRFSRAARGIITEVNLFGYAACEAAYRHGEPWRQELIKYLAGNRDYLYQFIAEHCPQIRMYPMAATYLAWLDMRELGLQNPVAHFEAHGIALSNGRDFSGEGWLRLNFGCPRAHLEKGLQRLLKGVRSVG